VANTKPDLIDGTSTYRLILDTTVGTTDAIKLGAAGGPSGPVTWHLQAFGTGSSGTFLPRFLLRGAEAAGYDAGDATVQEFFNPANTSTALTTAQWVGSYIIPADEWEVYLDYTADADPMTILVRAGRQ